MRGRERERETEREKEIEKEREQKRKRAKEREREMSSWNDVPRRPLLPPKIPIAGNVKARRTADAIPQRASTGIISEGDGGRKWRTNFSKTSRERNAHEWHLVFSPFLALPSQFFSVYHSL